MPRGRGLTRVAIVEDHALFAEALDVALTLEGHDVHRIPIDEERGQHRILATILRSHPRVVLLDLCLGSAASGIDLIRPLAQAGVDVVVVTGSMDRTRWGECLVNGARTVLSKTTPLNGILATIRLLHEGGRVLPHGEREALIAEFLQDRAQEHQSISRLATLTTREREVLDEMMNGRQVRQIAQDFVVSEATVRTQVKSILAKLGVSSQLAAVGVALRGRHHPTSRQRPG